MLKENGIIYMPRTKIIASKGPCNITLPLKYPGADDKAGPNYTGQNAVDFYYM